MIDFSVLTSNNKLNAEQVKNFFDNNPNASVVLKKTRLPKIFQSEQLDKTKLEWSFDINNAGRDVGYFYVKTKLADQINKTTGTKFNTTANVVDSMLKAWDFPIDEFMKSPIHPDECPDEFVDKLRQLINKVAAGAGEGDIFDKVNATNLTLGISNIKLGEFNENYFIQNIYFKKANSDNIENSDDDSMDVPF